MNDKSGMHGTRHEPRFSVRNLDATVVTVALRAESEESMPINGVAADVSATGLRLALQSPPPKDAPVSVHFCIPDISIDLMLEGVIRWIQPKDATSWWVGCALETPIPHASLQTMAMHDVMDRRQDVRLGTARKAKAKWELSNAVTDVTVVDYSVGGCAIVTEEPVEPASDRMMLIFDGDDEEETAIPVRVIWSRSGTRFGCEFLSNRCYLRIRKFVESECQTLDRVRRQARKRSTLMGSATRWRWIAVSAIVLLALRSVDLIGKTSDLWKSFDIGLQSFVGQDSFETLPTESQGQEHGSAESDPDA